MIHNLYESFDLIVYSGSHIKSKTQKLIHHHNRVVIRFPSKMNFFILFHGNLIHSGSCSKYEPHQYSLNYAQDLRAFAYIDKHKDSRNNESFENDLPHLSTVGVISSDDMCPKLQHHFHMKRNNISSCFHCDNETTTIPKNADTIIDIYDMYKKMTISKKSKENFLQPIIGNLKEDGWAIYPGINTFDINVVGNLFQDCREIINKPPRNMRWEQIQSPKPKLAGRYKFKIARSYFHEDDFIIKTCLNSIVSFYKKLLHEYIKKIEGFDQSLISEAHLFRNVGKVTEQLPHRDYTFLN